MLTLGQQVLREVGCQGSVGRLGGGADAAAAAEVQHTHGEAMGCSQVPGTPGHLHGVGKGARGRGADADGHSCNCHAQGGGGSQEGLPLMSLRAVLAAPAGVAATTSIMDIDVSSVI